MDHAPLVQHQVDRRIWSEGGTTTAGPSFASDHPMRSDITRLFWASAPEGPGPHPDNRRAGEEINALPREAGMNNFLSMAGRLDHMQRI
ncbi:hypothetical protein [Sphingobium bisphenolivorans]|uniref:hypothetical protein n=1 Tax=Sphingobium bisphenolivorans TaxID=1335760 RepID=UPI0003B79A89|nr:hypothetical protein [Sphingobium bisphenolivorans]